MSSPTETPVLLFAVLAPLFLAFELWQLVVSERYMGIKQIKVNADPRELPMSERVAAVWSIGLILYLPWMLTLLLHPVGRAPGVHDDQPGVGLGHRARHGGVKEEPATLGPTYVAGRQFAEARLDAHVAVRRKAARTAASRRRQVATGVVDRGVHHRPVRRDLRDAREDFLAFRIK